jgi:hypothetical protein
MKVVWPGKGREPMPRSMTPYGIEKQGWQRGCESSICEYLVTPVTSLTILYSCRPAHSPAPG